MNWTKYILFLMMIYLACSAKTCNEDEEVMTIREEQLTANLMDSVKHVFMSDTLSDNFLRAYELTARGKLNDLADYLNIASDTTLDLRFRQHTADLIRGLFFADEIVLHNWSRTYSESNLSTLELLISNSLSEGITCRITPVQITVSKQFEIENDSTYTGNLSFKSKCVPHNTNDLSTTESEELVIDIYLLKKLRSFGKDQIRVWDVYLGDIR